MTSSRLLTKVALKNYKSLAACDVELGPLTFLVGPNGAGKSNFLDALRFVAGSLRTSLEHALRERGGINEVRRRSGPHRQVEDHETGIVRRRGAAGAALVPAAELVGLIETAHLLRSGKNARHLLRSWRRAEAREGRAGTLDTRERVPRG